MGRERGRDEGVMYCIIIYYAGVCFKEEKKVSKFVILTTWLTAVKGKVHEFFSAAFFSRSKILAS
jgi:hypothetical protein